MATWTPPVRCSKVESGSRTVSCLWSQATVAQAGTLGIRGPLLRTVPDQKDAVLSSLTVILDWGGVLELCLECAVSAAEAGTTITSRAANADNTARITRGAGWRRVR